MPRPLETVTNTSFLYTLLVEPLSDMSSAATDSKSSAAVAISSFAVAVCWRRCFHVFHDFCKHIAQATLTDINWSFANTTNK